MEGIDWALIRDFIRSAARSPKPLPEDVNGMR
jgi:hypothetical protein